MNLTANIFENAFSIKSLVEKVRATQEGLVTFLETDSCFDTGGNGIVSIVQ